jgi:hypothetical protein
VSAGGALDDAACRRGYYFKGNTSGHDALPISGGSAIGLSATGAWAILVSLDEAAADDGTNHTLNSESSLAESVPD